MADDVVIRLATAGAGRTKADIDNVATSFGRISKAAQKAALESTGSLGVLDRKLQAVGKVDAGQGLKNFGSTLTRSVSLPMALAGGYATKMAADFDRSFSQIIGLTDVTADQAAKLKQQVLDLSGQTAKSPQELAEALYFVASAGGDVSDIFDTLQVSAKAAAAGMGETQTIASLVTGAMGAYGAAAGTAAQTTDILTAAIRTGRAEPAEFAETLGRVFPLAAQLGVSFDQVAAATAVMSNGAIDADVATTGLRQVFADILKPTQEAKQSLLAVGISSDELRKTLRERGLLATLQELKTQIGGNEEAIGTVIPDVRALTAVLSILGQEPDKVARVFDATANSAGSLDSAFQQFKKSASGQLQQALVDNQKALLDLGNAILPLAADLLPRVADAVETMAGAFAALPGPVKSLAVMGGLAAFAAGPVLRLAGTVVQLRTASALAAAASNTTTQAITEATRVERASSQSLSQLTTNMDNYASSSGNATRGAGLLRGALGGIGVTAAMVAVTYAFDQMAKKAREAADEVSRSLTAVGSDTQAQLDEAERQLKHFQDVVDKGAGGGIANFNPLRLFGGGETQGEKDLGEAIDKIPVLKKQIADLRAQLKGQEADAKRAGDATRRYGDDNSGAVPTVNALAEAAKAWQDNLPINPILDAAAASRSYDDEVDKLNQMLADNAEAEAERADKVAEANDRIEQAKERQTDAEQRLAEAVKGTSEVERRRLDLALQRDRLSAKSAVRDLAEAQDRVNRLSAGASPKQRAEAEAALEDARLRVEEANQQVADSEKAVADARPGSEAQARAVRDAEREVAQARRDVNQAYRDAKKPAEEAANREREVADQLDRVARAAEADIYGKIVTQGWTAEQATKALRDRLIEIRDIAPTLAGPINDLISALNPPAQPLSPFARKADAGRAQGGIDAFIATRQLIRMAEPQTGGEAYIPRLGISRGRGLSILDVAAGWYGARVVPMAAGGIMGVGGSSAQAQVVVVEKTIVENYNGDIVSPGLTLDQVRRDERVENRRRSLSRGSRGRR